MSETEHPSQQSAGAEPAPDFGRGKKVLVIDDDVTCVEMLRVPLEKSGFSVTTADNGIDGWQQMTPEGMPDVIVADAMMPGMSGLELFRELRRNDETKDIPVLIISIRKNMQDTFMAVGVDAFLAKPFHIREVLAILNRLLHAHPKRSPQSDDAQ